MASNVSNLNGNKSSNALVITDASGVPYASTVGINSDANSQNTFVKIPGEDLYYLFTIGTDAKPYYHIISPTSKSVLQKNMPVDNLSGYSFSMAVIMDEAGLGSSKLFLKQYQNDSTSLYAFNFDNSGITSKTLIDKVPSKDQDLSAPMVLANDASQLAVVINKAKPRFLFRSSPNTQLRIYDITSNHDTITISDSVTFSTHNLKSLAYSQNNTYLYYQKQDKQGVVDLYRYSISAQSSEAITAVSAQGKMKYANENIYIMDVEQIEVLSSTDTADIAYLPKSTISPAGSYKMSGFSASTTVAIAGHGSFIYGHQGNLYSRELDFKRYELKDLPKAFGIGNVRVVISDVKEPNATYDQFTADLKSYYNYYAFGMLQPNRHYTLAEEYKFGFNGMIMDNEITGGTGEHYDFGARIYSSRLGRWLSIDNISQADISDYSYVRNSPIRYIDVDGNIQRDASGNVIFFNVTRLTTGKAYELFPINDNTRYLESVAQVGFIFTDEGTPVMVVKVLGEKNNYFYYDSNGEKIRNNDFAAADKKSKTNCYGTSLTGGDFYIVDKASAEVILRDEFKIIKQKGNINTDNIKVGDIAVLNDGKHYIKAVGITDEGEIIWESKNGLAESQFGTLEELQVKHSNIDGDEYLDFNAANIEVYTKKEADKVRSNGKPYINEEGKKKIRKVLN